jgi:hypothetical protein
VDSINVKSVPCHLGKGRPQAVDGEDHRPIRRLGANTLNKHSRAGTAVAMLLLCIVQSVSATEVAYFLR